MPVGDKHQPAIEETAFLGMLRTADAHQQAVAALLRPHGLSPTQYNVLRILRGAGSEGLPCGEVGARMVTRDPDITRLLDRMEARGLVTRERRTTDRRVITARISSAGLALVDRLDEPMRRLHRQRLGHMKHEELRALVSLLATARGPKEAT